MRAIIVHFHFFKNAGTSIESILRKHFKERFLTREIGRPDESFPASALVPLLEARAEVQAVSSHTIYFPPPEVDGWRVFPIVFLRDPLDRILSMYNFERKQSIETQGARLAKGHSVADYIEKRLDRAGERTMRNYQTWMLARGQAAPKDSAALFEVARKHIENLPVVGLVEDFAKSVAMLNEWLRPHFPGLDAARA